jgi:FKBP-type peptidyl-prolyl cis-trans isomerase SlyD
MKITRDAVVRFHYTLNAADGERIESSRDHAEPLTYLHGHGNLLPALEQKLEGHAAGETLTAALAAAEAYGERREDAIMRVPLKHLHHQGRLAPGMVAGVQTEHGMRQVIVVKLGKFNADVDTNHPLAGRDLSFEIEILEVRVATGEEIAHGHVHGEGGHHH